MKLDRWNAVWSVALGSMFLAPALHPLLIPVVGVPSHLLWWIHVLPVATLTFRGGRKAAVACLLLSAGLVAAGELTFGAGYGVAAPLETVLALTTALTGTNVLVVGFALYARRVSSRYRLLFDRVRMGVLQVDARHVIVGVNPAAVAIAGATGSRSMTHRPLFDVIRGTGVDSLEQLERRGGWTGQVEIATRESRKAVHAVLAAAKDEDTGTYQVFLGDRSTEVSRRSSVKRSFHGWARHSPASRTSSTIPSRRSVYTPSSRSRREAAAIAARTAYTRPST